MEGAPGAFAKGLDDAHISSGTGPAKDATADLNSTITNTVTTPDVPVDNGPEKG